jgi:hypothetical protein
MTFSVVAGLSGAEQPLTPPMRIVPSDRDDLIERPFRPKIGRHIGKR